jgi:CheY-like chemotaxis protein
MEKMKECLLIDDDPDDQEIFLMCIEKISPSIRCLTSDNGVDAISMLSSSETYLPDYIFLDMNMPKMNGIECLKQIRKISRLDQTKIYMYSTTSDSSVVMQSKNLGAQGFIVKPARTGELKEKLSEVFQAH